MFIIVIVTAIVGIYLLSNTVVSENARVGLGFASLFESTACICLLIPYIKNKKA